MLNRQQQTGLQSDKLFEGREIALLRVWFTNDHEAVVHSAVGVADGSIVNDMPALVCFNAAGEEIGKFRLSEVVGYELNFTSNNETRSELRR